MIVLREIDTSDLCYAFVEHLWQSAFPIEERRDVDVQRYNVDRNDMFHCMLAEDKGQAVGFFTYWDFETYCYGEHFAIDDVFRNQGYGRDVLSALLRHIGKPLVIEVELPSNALSLRRIAFYQRNGLRVWEHFPYVQPPYRTGGSSIEMLLMATSDLDPMNVGHKVVRTIYSNVYGVLPD